MFSNVGGSVGGWKQIYNLPYITCGDENLYFAQYLDIF